MDIILLIIAICYPFIFKYDLKQDDIVYWNVAEYKTK